MECPYSVLNVPKNINSNDLKKVYRKLIFKHHPDKGGDTDTFTKIQDAYNKINNNNLSSKPSKSSFTSSTIDIFKSYFAEKSKQQLHDLYVSLEEIYLGKTIIIKLNQEVLCTKCSSYICKSCNGSGRVSMQANLFNISQTISKDCTSCNGYGHLYQCDTCNGSGYTYCDKIYKLKLKKGASENDKYSFENNMLIFILKIKNHCRFFRYNNDIILHKTISLYDALVGCTFRCKHLNNKVYTFRSSNTINYDSIYSIKNLGMPFKNSNTFGNMYIKFDIVFPEIKHLTDEQHLLLKSIFDLENEVKKSHSSDNCIDLNLTKDSSIDSKLLNLIRFHTFI